MLYKNYQLFLETKIINRTSIQEKTIDYENGFEIDYKIIDGKCEGGYFFEKRGYVLKPFFHIKNISIFQEQTAVDIDSNFIKKHCTVFSSEKEMYEFDDFKNLYYFGNLIMDFEYKPVTSLTRLNHWSFFKNTNNESIKNIKDFYTLIKSNSPFIKRYSRHWEEFKSIDIELIDDIVGSVNKLGLELWVDVLIPQKSYYDIMKDKEKMDKDAEIKIIDYLLNTKKSYNLLN